jgi:CAAX prenyl protease-like protein
MILNKLFCRSPMLARVVPFVVFVLLTYCQGKLGPTSAYWVYLFKTLAGIWLILEMRPCVAEIRWSFSVEAVVVGMVVFAVWVGISGEWTTQTSLGTKLGLSPSPNTPASAWNPLAEFSGALGVFFVAVRILGSALVVPPIEEAFYRSFLYRYIANQNFLSVPLNKFLPVPFIVRDIAQ